MQQQWSEPELEEHWSLNDEEQLQLSGLTEESRVGFAVYLKFFQNWQRPY